MKPTNKPVVAAFDFDGTLTRRDTLLPFLLHTLGAWAVARDALLLSPTLAGYALGLIDNGIAKERVLIRCLGGMRMADLQQLGERFAADVLPALLRDEAMQRLSWHKQQGHRCVVISASLELYVRPWALKAGFDDVAATHLEIRGDGYITGKLSGANCFGSEKVRRLEALCGGTGAYTLYAYGDSRGDKELLSAADHAYYRKIPD
ncbi:MAG: HAD family hydrolase [Nitrosomonadales bacterium]|nr:HAD family hydrolase [Nitrosomonadales bacterium]